MRLFLLASFLSSTAISVAQPPGNSADMQLSPQAAYEHAAAPVDITHRDIANWSDIELGALNVAVQQAKTACIEREQTTYKGEQLIGYARLCALGQQWPNVYEAATKYINSGEKERPELAQAYAFEVQADLNMRKGREAEETAVAMLKAVPYSPLVDDVTTAAVRYLQFSATPDALDLLMNRQRILLALMRGTQPDGGEWPSEPTVSPIPLHTVFQHALDEAALDQYMGKPAMAAAIVKDIDDALPKDLLPDEAILITEERRQYELLGTTMPELKSAVSLAGGTHLSVARPVFGNVTIYLLFPPWCAQCVRLGPQLQAAIDRNQGDTNLKLYALLADKAPEPQKHASGKTVGHEIAGGKRTGRTPSVPADENLAPKAAAELLAGTPTFVVPPSTLEEFGATDFPFLIATDHNGVIRLLYPAAPNNALVEGGIVDQIAASILVVWPVKPMNRPPGAPSPH